MNKRKLLNVYLTAIGDKYLRGELEEYYECCGFDGFDHRVLSKMNKDQIRNYFIETFFNVDGDQVSRIDGTYLTDDYDIAWQILTGDITDQKVNDILKLVYVNYYTQYTLDHHEVINFFKGKIKSEKLGRLAKVYALIENEPTPSDNLVDEEDYEDVDFDEVFDEMCELQNEIINGYFNVDLDDIFDFVNKVSTIYNLQAGQLVHIMQSGTGAFNNVDARCIEIKNDVYSYEVIKRQSGSIKEGSILTYTLSEIGNLMNITIYELNDSSIDMMNYLI